MAEGLRLDKWLWFARFYKTRTLAQKTCAGGNVRVNGEAAPKGARLIKVGDEIDFLQGDFRRSVIVQALGERRGPAPEAQSLYIEPTPPLRVKDRPGASPLFRPKGTGRPTKKERREIDRFKEK